VKEHFLIENHKPETSCPATTIFSMQLLLCLCHPKVSL